MLAKLHPRNSRRIEVLRDLKILDSGPEHFYDELTNLTAKICDVPICLVSLVDEDRQWFKSKCGFEAQETPIEMSLCSHAVSEEKYLEIPDTRLDERSSDNPLCQNDDSIRFYAGALLRTLDGWPLGTLCVLDVKPRRLTPLQKQTLMVHAGNVSKHIELTKALIESVQDIELKSAEAMCSENFLREKYQLLTPREKQVLDLIMDGSFGSSSKKIARELEISPRTVDHHRSHIMSKLEVDSVAELIATTLRAGLSGHR